jgi:hypothetical protein
VRVKVAFEAISADEHDRLTALYGPLTDAVRDLLDATIRTQADQDAIRSARAQIQVVTETLRARQRDESQAVHYAVDERPLAWSNPVIGLRNPIAPPLVIHHDGDAEGVKTFVSGHLSDSEGVTVEAEGIFVQPAWAREVG